jgi:hypothetical protein
MTQETTRPLDELLDEIENELGYTAENRADLVEVITILQDAQDSDWAPDWARDEYRRAEYRMYRSTPDAATDNETGS